MTQPFEPFDRAARRRARSRALPAIAGHDPLLRHVQQELADRHALLSAPPGPHLAIGLLLPPQQGMLAMDCSLAAAQAARRGGVAAVQADEDRLPFRDHALARITSLMVLHGVNDLPGALILMRRALMPGGRLVAALPAGWTLGALRDAFLTADTAAGGGVPARLGPTVDPAVGAGLLLRAGFHEPVADVDAVTIRTPDLSRLARDIRGMGDSGWLAVRPRGLTTPRRWAMAEAQFAAGAEADGRVPVTVQILYLSARAPG